MLPAACLWTSACCGLAVGIGFYGGAILGLVLSPALPVLLNSLLIRRILRKHLPEDENADAEKP